MSGLKRLFSSAPIHADLGLLVLRLVIGFSMFAFHGYGKLAGGPERWAQIGSNMAHLGITFQPVLWGFLAASAESIGSVLIALGLLFRPAAAVLAFTMFVAMLRHLSIPEGAPGAGWNGASHAMELLAVYAALFFTGAGRYALVRRS